MSSAPLRVAVVTGGHSFDVPGFHVLFRSFAPRLDAYVQHLDDWCSSPAAVRGGYDVALFYTMMNPTPVDDGLPWYAGQQLRALSELGQTGQGIVVLHHALLAYPEWPLWGDLCGLANRSFGYHVGQTVVSRLVAPEHPITAGLADWTMVDETYTTPDAGPGNEVLITYDHPVSMKTIAWTRTFGQARVFCYQAGHDNRTWVEPSFREVLARGIAWAAGRL